MPPTIPATLALLHAAYRRGALKPSDVVEHWLALPTGDRGAPVWISTVEAGTLRERARALDDALAADADGVLRSPVFGALCAVKDNIDVAGLPTTAACPAFAYSPAESAPVVASLERGGALVVGKTNLDQFATGLVGTRSPYGPVPNAFDPRYVAGGSSSGSAVAVARGLVAFALGTDTAGSGRVPAGLNGIVGWKPTRGLLSTRGTVPACRSIDCISIFALTVGDAARVFEAGGATSRGAGRGRTCDRPRVRAGFTFGTPQADPAAFDGDERAARAYASALALLASLGGTQRAIDFAPWRAVAATLYDGPRVAERLAGIRAFFDAHADEVEPTVRSILEGGRRYSASDAYAADAVLAAQREALVHTWSDIDVLVVPTAPTIYTLDAVAAQPVELNRRLGSYTNFVNLLDLAAIAVPASIRDDGLPFGITLIGPAGSDLMLADLAQRFHVAAGVPLGALGIGSPGIETLPAPQDVVQVAVVGAHLTGMPLNHELAALGARLARRGRTSASYRLYALPGTSPPKPGLVRTDTNPGHAIDVEVYELATAAFGAFVARVPRPLSIGTLELDDGSEVKGFLCESAALAGAEDISRYGGWRAYLTARAQALPAPAPVT